MKSILRLLAPLCLLLALSGMAAAQTAPPPPPAEALSPETAPATGHESHDHGHTAPATPPVAAPASATEAPTNAAAASPIDVFRVDFMWHALLAGLLIGGVCAYLGVYVILRRIVFVGMALAEFSSAGVALALLTGAPPMVGSVALTLAGVGVFSVRWAPRRVRQDAFIGIGYAVASAAAILAMAKSPRGEGHLLEVLFGNILTVTLGDVGVTALALAAVVVIHALFAKEILFVAFDPDTAAASGYRPRVWETLLYVTIGLTIAFAIHAVGVLLAFASLVIPPVTALLLTNRMKAAFTASVVAGLIPVPVGLYLSFVWDLPSAATVVGTGFVLLLAAGVYRLLRADR